MTDVTDPGYDFVPLAPDVRRVERAQACWDRHIAGTLAGYIDVTLTAEQPLHIGSGSKAARPPHVVQRAARICDRPGIPGSSLKGVLRARYEAITRSCTSLFPGDRPVKIRSSTSSIRRARLTSAVLEAAVLRSACDEKRTCPACALFGRMSLRSRITITDLAATSEAAFEPAFLPERFGPNLHHVGTVRVDASGDVFEVHRLRGRKFHLGRGPAAPTRQQVEAIPAGTQLTGRIGVFNATLAELGGLLTALGNEPASALKLGGGKAHGFGRVRASARFALHPSGAARVDPAHWRQAFIDSPDRWAEGEHRLIELHRGGC